MYLYAHICVYLYMYICLYVYMSTCLYVYVYMSTCMYMSAPLCAKQRRRATAQPFSPSRVISTCVAQVTNKACQQLVTSFHHFACQQLVKHVRS